MLDRVAEAAERAPVGGAADGRTEGDGGKQGGGEAEAGGEGPAGEARGRAPRGEEHGDYGGDEEPIAVVEMIRGAGDEAGGGGAEEGGRAQADDEGGERGRERAVVGQKMARMAERGVGHGHEQEGLGGFLGAGAGAQGEAVEQKKSERGTEREDGGGEPDGEADVLGTASVVEGLEVGQGVLGGGDERADPGEEGVFGLGEDLGNAGQIGGGERTVKLDTAVVAALVAEEISAARDGEDEAQQDAEDEHRSGKIARHAGEHARGGRRRKYQRGGCDKKGGKRGDCALGDPPGGCGESVDQKCEKVAVGGVGAERAEERMPGGREIVVGAGSRHEANADAVAAQAGEGMTPSAGKARPVYRTLGRPRAARCSRREGRRRRRRWRDGGGRRVARPREKAGRPRR